MRARVLLTALSWIALAAASPMVLPARPLQAETLLPRRVVALYSSLEEPRLRASAAHQLATMPLNWLGLTVDLVDVRGALPAVWDDPDVLGVLSWFQSPIVEDGPAYLAWAQRVAASGRRLVVLGDAGVSTDPRRPGSVDAAALTAFYGALGVRYGGGWNGITFDSRLDTPDAPADETTRPLGELLPAFELFTPADPAGSTSFVVVSRPGPGGRRMQSHVAVATPRGGFVAPGFSHSRDAGRLTPAWHIDPFRFFEVAFGLAGRPVPDATTLVGRRIYYGHIDGDGWLSRSLAVPAGPGGDRPLASEVVRQRAIVPFPDLPVTVAPIAAELDPDWLGTTEAQAVARALFALPQVEPASHTYTHPFQWDFFDPYDPAREAPFAGDYARARPYAGGEAHENDENTDADVPPATLAARQAVGLRAGYVLPRAYGGRPFDMVQEMAGAAAYIAGFAPTGKPVTLVQWSGDTSPTEAALAEARAAGLANLNGGDSRLDDDYPSVASVAPLGRRIGGQVQVYASASNENTYTDLWRGRFFGFRDVTRTWDNTEAPRRLKPVNLYYHMYSGEKPASLRALLDNLADLRRRELAPITASAFARTVEGFFALRLVELGARAWRIEGRGALQTLRLPVGPELEVDLAGSAGVLGSRRTAGALYVALDPAVEPARLVLVERGTEGPTLVSLEHARWPMRDLRRRADGFSVRAAGYGEGEMAWRVPSARSAEIRAGTWRTTRPVGPDGRLVFTVPVPPEGPATTVAIDVTLRP